LWFRFAACALQSSLPSSPELALPDTGPCPAYLKLPFYVRLERNGYQNCGFRNIAIFSEAPPNFVPERVTPSQSAIASMCACCGLTVNKSALKADAGHPRDTIM
jgi:hypothetical protein